MLDSSPIPEFGPSRREILVADAQVSHPAPTYAPLDRDMRRRFTKGASVAEIHERRLREFHAIEWSLLLNGLVITTRRFHDADRADYDRELQLVTGDLQASGWLEVPSAGAAR